MRIRSSLKLLMVILACLAAAPVAAQAQDPPADIVTEWSAQGWMDQSATTMGALDQPERQLTRVILVPASDKRGPELRYRCDGQAPPGLRQISYFSRSSRNSICGGGELSGTADPNNPNAGYRGPSVRALRQLQTNMLTYSGVQLGRYSKAQAVYARLALRSAVLVWACPNKRSFHPARLIITNRYIEAIDCMGQTSGRMPNDGPAQSLAYQY